MPKTKPIKPTPPEVTAEFGYLTDRQLEAVGLTPESAYQTVLDATLLYQHIGRNANVTHDELVQYANAKWDDASVDRLNAALGYLKRAGKVVGSP